MFYVILFLLAVIGVSFWPLVAAGVVYGVMRRRR